MPPKSARGYRCRECGWETVAYVGRCGECQAWNTLEQYAASARPTAGSNRRGVTAIPARTVPLESVPDDAGERMETEIPELDRVLGGGLVAGALILVGGDPGIGKSTLMLQVRRNWQREGGP